MWFFFSFRAFSNLKLTSNNEFVVSLLLFNFFRQKTSCQYNYFPRGVKQIKEAEILTNFQSIVLKFVSNFFLLKKCRKGTFPLAPVKKTSELIALYDFFLFTKTIFLWFVWKNETFESMYVATWKLYVWHCVW